MDREAIALRRYDSLDKVPQQDADLWIEYQDAVVAQGLSMGLKTKRLYVEAGDTLIWHPQLPHGGTPIKDVNRTRFSWVVHTTPVGVPVYYQDAFFNPKNSFSDKAPWTTSNETDAASPISVKAALRSVASAASSISRTDFRESEATAAPARP